MQLPSSALFYKENGVGHLINFIIIETHMLSLLGKYLAMFPQHPFRHGNISCIKSSASCLVVMVIEKMRGRGLLFSLEKKFSIASCRK